MNLSFTQPVVLIADILAHRHRIAVYRRYAIDRPACEQVAKGDAAAAHLIERRRR